MNYHPVDKVPKGSKYSDGARTLSYWGTKYRNGHGKLTLHILFDTHTDECVEMSREQFLKLKRLK